MLTKKLKQILPENFWKKGGGEILSFVIVVPCILFMVCAIIAAAQIGYVNQTLNFCAYNAGRAAVISDSERAAENRVIATYETQFGMQNARKYGYAPIEMKVLDGEKWEKGAFVQCTVRYYIKTLTPFTSGLREQSIVMMIENGDV